MLYTIYKIYKPNTDYLYIGCTNKFNVRKYRHKRACYNRVKKAYHRLLYKTIRDNEGFDTFIIEPIESFETNDKYAAFQKEQDYILLLKPNLNMISPPKKKLLNVICDNV